MKKPEKVTKYLKQIKFETIMEKDITNIIYDELYDSRIPLNNITIVERVSSEYEKGGNALGYLIRISIKYMREENGKLKFQSYMIDDVVYGYTEEEFIKYWDNLILSHFEVSEFEVNFYKEERKRPFYNGGVSCARSIGVYFCLTEEEYNEIKE